MENKIIPKFLGEYRFLSNFHVCDIEFDGRLYTSTEAAYQSAKTLNPLTRDLFRDMTPSQARKEGQQLEIRPNWDNVKVDVMRKVNLYKYVKHSDLTDKLLATGDAYLMEGTWWHDNFWGVCTCAACKLTPGQNNLGRVLMEIRKKIKDKIDATEKR
jgi:ribA/ribD-fused uncharacterized protein